MNSCRLEERAHKHTVTDTSHMQGFLYTYSEWRVFTHLPNMHLMKLIHMYENTDTNKENQTK